MGVSSTYIYYYCAQSKPADSKATHIYASSTNQDVLGPITQAHHFIIQLEMNIIDAIWRKKRNKRLVKA